MSVIGFPLLLVPLAVYNIVAFLMPGLGWTDPVTTVAMVSGVTWTLTFADLFIAGSLLLLFLEIAKATRMSRRGIVDHVLSFFVFVGMLIEFLLVKEAATGTFFLLLVIALVDVLAGFIVSVRTAQRGVTVEPGMSVAES